MCLLACLALAGCGAGESPPPAPKRTLEVERVYMGVSCSKPNSIRCDRVGLAVWLPHGVKSLRATIAGKPVAMRPPERDGRGWWEGFLQPAGMTRPGPMHVVTEGGMRFTGRVPVTPRVRLRATWPDGSSGARSERVRLSAGWG